MFEITQGKIAKAQKVVIYGPEGIGKSTFASQFPNSLFIDVEGSTNSMEVKRLPAPTSWAMFNQEVDYIKQNPDLCSSLIIDTADWAEQLALNHICSMKQIKGIEDIGYGKGYVYLAEEFGRLLNKLNELIDLGINVVFTAHAIMRKFEQPDELGAYDRFELKLQKKTGPLLKEWADMLLFANYKTTVVNVDNQGAVKGKNKVQGGKRTLYTEHHSCWDAKNRHGLPPEVDFDYRSIAHIFNTVKPTQSVKEPTAEPEPLKAQSQAPVQETPKNEEIGLKIPGVNIPIDSKIPAKLWDLMSADEIKEEEIRQIVGSKGYFPYDMPVEDYPQDFIDQWLMVFWPNVVKDVKEIRNKKEFPFY